MLAPGDVLAGYRLEEQVGRGGMGVVFRAEHLGLGRRAAVKVMSAQMAADDRFRERFKREARLAASIDHPNIVPVYEAGEDGPHLFIAMRFVDGTDLAAVLAGGTPLDPRWTVGIITQVAAALDAAHRRGLVHRDVKPGNVLLAADDAREGEVPHAYLTDFGITREVEATHGLTATGAFVGSVQYAAPEQIEGAPPSPATDVYALGCLAYQCLAGVPPFTRDHDIATLWAHVNDPVEPPSGRVPALPASVDAVVGRALAKSPEERFATCSAFAASLAAALGPEERTLVEDPVGDSGQETISDPRQERAAVAGSAAAALRDPTSSGSPDVAARGARRENAGTRRRRLVLTAVALVAVLAVTAGIGLVLAGGGSQAEASALDTPAGRVELPEGGRPQDIDTLPALPELNLRSPAAGTVDGTVVRVGQLAEPRAGADPLPEELSRAAGSAAPVRLPGGEALRYDIRRGGGLLRIYALPVEGGDWLVLSCETPSVAAVEACDAAAAGLRPRGTAAGVAPDAAFADGLSRARATLERARAEDAAGLRAASRTRRARAARQLASAHTAAARALGELDPPAQAASAIAGERRALTQLASGFAALAAAASSGNRAGYERARERIATAERRRVAAQAALREAGYAPATR